MTSAVNSKSMAASRSSGHFESMDGLRGVAAAAVLLGHAQVILAGETWVQRKYLAVQFFFMLSGFVVGYAYENRILGGMSAAEFYLRRIIRLYPLIILGTIIGSIWLYQGDPQFRFNPRTIVAVILAGAAFPSPYTHFSFGRFPVNPPEWSLFLEIAAYFAFGALVKYFNNLRLATLCIMSLAAYSVIQFQYFDAADTPFFLNSFGAAYSFSMGLLIWRGLSQGALPGVKLPLPILGILLFGACVAPKSLGWIVDALSVAILFPAIIVSAATNGPSRANSFVQFLGNISYPLYILHWPILQATRQLILPSTVPVAAVVIGCTSSVILAYGALIFYDIPTRKWLTTKLVQRFAGAT